MTQTPLPPVLIMLAHPLRWQLLQSLTHGDYRVNELVEQVGQPANLVSYHLRQLRSEDLVSARRSEADGRDMYYTLNLETLNQHYHAAGNALHPLLGNLNPNPVPPKNAVVLFVCTHNSARSQLAEALFRRATAEQLFVTSAGSQPSGIHPLTFKTAERLGLDLSQHQSRGFEAVAHLNFDYVITVCDRAREVCPAFPGPSQHLHWGLPDPLLIENAATRKRAFDETARQLQRRIDSFLAWQTA